MKSLNNPFVIYGYKGAEYFCDRVNEVESIINALENERNITLIAPRRIGKTGLIHRVFEEIRSKSTGTECFYLDILSTRNLDQFVELMAQSILGQLDTTSQAAMRKITTLLGSLRPTLTFDQISGKPTLSVDIARGQGEQSLRDIFEYLKQSGKRCYIAIDEFQQITKYPEQQTEALLRSYIQFIPNVYFIFAGSQQHMMTEMFLSAKRPFYLSSQMISLSPIDRDVYRIFANRFFKASGREISASDFDFLYDTVDGQTWYVQAILNRLFQYSTEMIDRELIAKCIEELVQEQAQVFENYYALLTDNQALLLKSIAQEGRVHSPMARAFAAKHHLPALSSIKMALDHLIDKQLVCRHDDAYVVYDRFFGKWLAGRH